MSQPRQIVKIRSLYFPVWFLIFFSVASVLASLLYFSEALISCLLIVNLFFWSAEYVTLLDMGRKVFKDYFSIAGLKFDYREVQFDGLDRIFITKEKVSHSYRSRGIHRDASWVEYTANLLFLNGQVEELVVETDKDKLLAKVKPFANSCKIGIESRTSQEWYLIDMS